MPDEVTKREIPAVKQPGPIRRAAQAIRRHPWWVGLGVLVALELAREQYGAQYPVLEDLAKALSLALGGT